MASLHLQIFSAVTEWYGVSHASIMRAVQQEAGNKKDPVFMAEWMAFGLICTLFNHLDMMEMQKSTAEIAKYFNVKEEVVKLAICQHKYREIDGSSHLMIRNKMTLLIETHNDRFYARQHA